MVKVTYYGQSCFEIQTKGKYLLTDPMISLNPLAKHVDKNQLKADYILVSHGHGDHTFDVIDIAKNTDPVIISNYEIVDYFSNKGLKGHHMNTGGSFMFEFGKLKYVNALHSSSLPDGTYAGNPGGFVLSNEEICFYFAGDTALTLDMKLIPVTSPQLDFAILPIGDNFTMGYEDAIIASDFINCNTIIGCHYDSFPVIEIDKKKAVKAFESKGKKLLLPEIGETLTF